MLIWLQTACISNEVLQNDFPKILEPLEDIRVEVPQGDDFPEEIVLLSEDGPDYASVHARGYLHLSLDNAWTALRNDLVYVNQRDVSNYTVTEMDSDEYDYIFLVDNEVQDIIPVAFTNEWRHVGHQNHKEDVIDVVVRWRKIEGTDFIQLLEGSVEIIPVEGEDAVVEIRIIEHLKATLDQEANAIEFVTDMAERWKLVGHGESIPNY
ncbi:MAG: hypothetical protein CL916_11005 [Deltaproteobacteria bacterium]|nr:hypothetical protein [Deltaproteobacteria bacterium]